MKTYKEFRLEEGFFNKKTIKQLGTKIKQQAGKIDNGREILNRIKERFDKDYKSYQEPKEFEYTKGMSRDEKGLTKLILQYYKESMYLGQYMDVNKVSKSLLPFITHKSRVSW